MITIRPDTTEFRQKFPVLIAQARNPRALLLGVGREGANYLKTYFRQKDQTNVNKLNPDRREHFWLQISRSVQAPVVNSDTSVSISINDPRFAQKVFGGPIVAKRARNLSIPVEKDAYGRTPATYEQETGFKLFLVHGANQLLLARALGDGRVQIEYLLTPRVNQAPDPTALPDERLLVEKLLARGQTIVDQQNRQN